MNQVSNKATTTSAIITNAKANMPRMQESQTSILNSVLFNFFNFTILLSSGVKRAKEYNQSLIPAFTAVA